MFSSKPRISVLKKKKMDSKLLVRERLQKCREELNLSIEDVAKGVKVRKAFIEALEEGRFSVFGARVYGRAVFKKIAAFMGMDGEADLARLFDAAWDEWEQEVGKKKTEKKMAGPRFSVTPRIIWRGIAASAIGGALIFFSAKLIRFLRPPDLLIQEPQDERIVEDSVVGIKGKTERENRLTVNGREITIDGEGRFETDIDLLEGVNTLHFISENRFGRKKEIIRRVVSK
jgi:transcriptional regulator with XRE-family HTH domain